jgi:hypothetical protein
MTAALGAGVNVICGNNGLAALIAVICGNSVAPPELTRDTPVLSILHPVEIVLIKSFGDELDATVAYSLDSGLCEGLHLYEPLKADHRLDSGTATVASAYLVLDVVDLTEISALFEILKYCLTSLIAIHTRILGICIGDLCILGENDFHRKLLTASNLKVVGVVCGSDLNATGTLIELCVLVGNDRNTATYERKYAILTDKILISFVLGVNCYRSIAKKSFGTSGSNLNVSSTAYEGILDMPKMAVLLNVVNLGVRDRGFTVRAPVDDTLTAVNETLLVKALENVANSAAAALVKGEALTGPVAGGAHLLEL